MLWEVMIEMTIELLKVAGEIISTLFSVLKSMFQYFFKKKKKTAGKPGVGPDGKPLAAGTVISAEAEAAEVAAAAKKKGELIMIFTVLGLAFAGAMMVPKLRHAVFGQGSGVLAGVTGEIIVEKQRNQYPMGQYTSPQFYSKRKFVVEDGGLRRQIYYYWYAPPADAGQKLPLVVILHDKDGTSPAAIYLRTAAVQKQFPAYLLIPQSPAEKVWDAPARYSGQEFPKAELAGDPGDAAKSLRDAVILMANLTEAAPIDEKRMYVIGCGEGGTGVLGAAAHFPGIFAAGVSIGGKWSYLDANKMARTPLLMLNGVTDKVVPPAFPDNMARIIAAAGGQAAFHAFPNIGHECDPQIFYSPAVWRWMFSQARPDTPAAKPAAAAPPR